MIAAAGEKPAEVRRLVGALEHASEHPIARAIDAATEAVGELPPVTDFANRQGLGVTEIVDSHAVVAGRTGLLDDWAMRLPVDLTEAKDRAEAAGRTVIAAGWDGKARAVLVVADTVKPTSAAAIAGLRQLGLRPVLLTGDNRRAAAEVAAAVGIDPATC